MLSSNNGGRALATCSLNGHRTVNHYAQAPKSFCEFLVRNRRLAVNLLSGLCLLNAAVDVRHRRRALTAEERAKLIESARKSSERIQGYSDELRALLYELAGLTGLRRRELASLTPASFDFDSPLPIVTVEAACSKHRQTDTIPLHPYLVSILPPRLKALKPDEFLFPGLENKKT
jgi:integrase